MNEKITLHIRGSWNEVKEKIKESNSELTDSDLQYEPGRERELLDHLAKKMHRDPQDVRAWIESISFNKGKAS